MSWMKCTNNLIYIQCNLHIHNIRMYAMTSVFTNHKEIILSFTELTAPKDKH